MITKITYYAAPVCLIILIYNVFCDAQSNGNTYLNNNNWSRQNGYPNYNNGSQSFNLYRTSTPWPALQSNSYNSQYSDIIEAALPDPVWVRSRNSNSGSSGDYFSNNRYSNSYNGRYGPSSANGRSDYENSGYSNRNQNRNIEVDVTDEDLREFSENLLGKDNNNAADYLTIDYQGRTSSRSQRDEAPLPLITVENNAVFNIPTISKLKKLYDNYELYSNTREHQTEQEKTEEENLLNAILETEVMRRTKEFLIQKGKIGRNPNDFKNLLKEIWFEMYPRGGRNVGSSGFEHVFVAEIKNNQISGFHNWVFFNEQEKNSLANYLGYMKKLDLGGKGAIVRLHFTYNDVDKPVGSMFIGTSPEFEMALYTTCFVLRADRVCPLKLNNNRFIIRTFTYKYHGKKLIGSAFPEI